MPPTPSFTPSPTVEAAVDGTATPAATTVSPRTSDMIEIISLYDEKLNPNWSLDNSQNMQYALADVGFVQKGKFSLKAQPAKGFGRLFFTVNKNSRDIYPRGRLLGVRLWLSGGDHLIATSDLAITITGSNQYTYWVPNDTSVKINTVVTPDAPLFSETRLYDLGINRSIPAKSWVEVVIWLDRLLYDPEYQYVTGMYIKNDELFTEAFYLDHMDLLLEPKP